MISNNAESLINQTKNTTQTTFQNLDINCIYFAIFIFLLAIINILQLQSQFVMILTQAKNDLNDKIQVFFQNKFFIVLET